MWSVIKSIGAVLAGIVAAFFVIAVIEIIGMMIIPPPAGLDPHDPESVRAAMESGAISTGSLLFPLLELASTILSITG